jgi:iron-sulfur cluster assembly protein
MSQGGSAIMVTITPEAGEQLKGVLSQQGGPNAGLRLFVQSSCGCGNVGYGMGVDEAGATDSVFESDGVRVIVDPASATLLNDATIDFVNEGPFRRGFVIHTADEQRGAGGCGCGAH